MPIGVGVYFIRDECTDPLLQYSDIQPTENGILASAEYEVDTAISKFQATVGYAARAWRTYSVVVAGVTVPEITRNTKYQPALVRRLSCQTREGPKDACDGGDNLAT
ncbi:hypothetical protein BDV09DRAFT_189970 [Aspergillus tetrazonus]